MEFQTVLEALSDPNRRRILELLKKKELSVGEIGESFEISGASLSFHLNKLKSANLVIAKRRGQQIFYSIHMSVFEEAAGWAAEFFSLGGTKGARNEKRVKG